MKLESNIKIDEKLKKIFNDGKTTSAHDARAIDYEKANEAAVPAKIIQITEADVGKSVFVMGKITKIQITKGPIVLSLFDGTSTILVKSFDRLKKDELKVGDVIKTIIEISIYQESLEGVLKKYFKVTNKDEFIRQITDITLEKAKPTRAGFMINSEVFQKLKQAMLKSAFEIRKAVIEQRPIIIRHHDDMDGYACGLALERAIISFMKENHPNINTDFYLKRAALRSPYYDYTDCIKDIALAKETTDRFGTEKPLIIIADTGSSIENLTSLKRLKLENFPIIVVDHHYDNNSETSRLIDVHINPVLVKENASNIAAGFLACELANMITNDDFKNEFCFAALLAGYADKSDAVELSEYRKLFSDMDEQLIKKLITIADFESDYIKFDGYSLINQLIIPDKKQLNKIADMFYDGINDQVKAFEKAICQYAEQMQHKNLLLSVVPIFLINYKRTFPSNMRIVSTYQDAQAERNKDKFVMTLATTPESITIRGSHNINKDKHRFSAVELIKAVQKEFPDDVIDGGGHPLAGTLRFSEMAKDKILTFVIEQIKKCF